jgi:chromosome segregation ATPase
LETLDGKYRQADSELQSFKRDAEAWDSQVDQAFTNLETAKKKARKLKEKQSQIEGECRACRVQLAKAQKEYAAAQKVEDEQMEKARQYCEMVDEVESDQSTVELQKEIIRIEHRLRHAASRQGGRSLADIELDLNEAKKAHDDVTEILANLKTTLYFVVSGALDLLA